MRANKKTEDVREEGSVKERRGKEGRQEGRRGGKKKKGRKQIKKATAIL